MTVTIDNSGPPAAPLDALKAYLRIALADEDDLLTDLLRAASDVAERFVGQLLLTRGVEEILTARCDWQRLAMRPVASITSVATLSLSGTEAALPVEAYSIDIDGNGDGWLRLHALDESKRLIVRYRAGIAAEAAAVPDAIRHGIVRLAADYYALREGVEPRPPASVAALWRPWRRMHLI